MKKSILILSVLLIVAVLFSLSACGPSEPTIDKLNEVMNNLESYEMNGVMTGRFKVQGIEIVISGEELLISSKSGENSPYYYSESTSTVSLADGSNAETLTSLVGYYEGDVYISKSGDGRKHKLYSAMSADDFSEYMDKGSTDLHDFESCVIETADDGSITFALSQYDKEKNEKMLRESGFDQFSEDLKISDILLTIVTDPELFAKEVTLSFAFEIEEGEEFQPEIKAVYTYSNHNSATPITDKFDKDSFEEVSDIRLLDTFEEGIEDIANSENGKLELDITTTTIVSSRITTTTEKDLIEYGVKDGKYWYEVIADVNKSLYVINYEDGSQKTITGGSNTSEEKTDEQAKEFIKGLVNSARFDKDYVSEINDKGDGVYSVKCRTVNSALYQPIYSSVGGTYSSGDLELTFTVIDGKITEISAEAYTGGTARVGNSTYNITVIIESTLKVVS